MAIARAPLGLSSKRVSDQPGRPMWEKAGRRTSGKTGSQGRGTRATHPVLWAAIEAMESRWLLSLPPSGLSSSNQFFDFDTVRGSTGNSNYIQAPSLNNTAASIANVQAYLNSVDGGNPLNPAQPLAVQIFGPLTNPSAIAIFSDYKVSYVYAQYNIDGLNFASGNTSAYAAADAGYAALVSQVTIMRPSPPVAR